MTGKGSIRKVLIITYYWPPSGGAGVQRWLKFSKYLPEYDWKPVILTVDPAKATYPLLDESLHKDQGSETEVIRTNTREWFSVYKKVSGSDRVPYAGFASESSTTSFKQKVARFVRGNFFLPDPRKGWNAYAIKAGRELIEETAIDCIVTSGPPHSSHLIGQKLSKEFGIPWIADFRDPWTDIYYYRQFYPTWFARRIDLYLERKVLTGASLVLTVSQGFKNIFLGKNCIQPDKVKIIPNGFDEEDFQNKVFPDTSTYIITYVGTLSDIYPIDSFIKAFKSLLKEYPNFRLQFIGSVSNNQLINLRQLPTESVTFIPYVEHKRAIEYMEDSHVLLLVIPEHNSGSGILPGKIFEYLASDRKILGIGLQEGNSAAILEETGAGVMVSSDNIEAIKKTLLDFYNASLNKKTSSGEKKHLKYSRKNLTGELAGYMNSLQ